VHPTSVLVALAPLLLQFPSKITPRTKLTTALLDTYMNTPPRQVGAAPGHGKYQKHYPSPHTHPACRDKDSEWFDNVVSTFQSPGNLQSHHESLDQFHGFANDTGQYQNLHGNENNLLNPQGSDSSLPFDTRNSHDLLRDIASYAAQSSRSTQNVHVVASEGSFSCGAPSPHHFASNSMSTRLFQMEHTAPPEEPVVPRQTKYDPFQHLFHTSDQARDHRRRATRFDRLPYYDPESDHTIADIEHSRIYHVMRIYNAMTSGESAKDNRGSIAMKRWVIDAHYPPDLVEAYAHKVFDCLLAQAKEGFRGWVHNDYVADERKGDDIDKDVDCAGRLDNIILALEQEKTICEDVMNSACQIRMFVNAPRAYANRKHQNRVGNSKRGRTKDTLDANPRAAKTQKTGGRHTRARSTTGPSSRGTTPQRQQVPPLMPPYYSSPSQQSSSSKSGPITLSTTQPIPLHRPNLSAPLHSFGPRFSIHMSPPTSSPRTPHAPQTHTPRMITEPPHHQLPSILPSPFINNTYHAPLSPEDAKPSTIGTTLEGWHYGGGFGEASYIDNTQSGPVIDPALYPLPMDLANLTRCETSEGATMSNNHPDEFVNLSQIEQQLCGEVSGNSNQGPYGDFWHTCMEPGSQDHGSR
jgi:hypothetical protein